MVALQGGSTQFFDFMSVQTWPAHSRNRTWNFELGSCRRLGVHTAPVLMQGGGRHYEGPLPRHWHPFCVRTALLFVPPGGGFSKLHELSTLHYKIRFVWRTAQLRARWALAGACEGARLSCNVGEPRCIARTFSVGCFQHAVRLSRRSSISGQGRSIVTQRIDLWCSPYFGSFPSNSVSFAFSYPLHVH